jgi:hypothetical protein
VHTAYDPAPHNHSQHNQCRTPYAVVHGLVLLMMGIMMSETCRDRSLIINIGLLECCWFLSLHPTFMKHGHKNLKLSTRVIKTVDQNPKNIYADPDHDSQNGITAVFILQVQFNV